MSASFAFGFENDDIDADDQNDQCSISQELHPKATAASSISTQLHSLHDILSSIPSQLSFSTLSVPSDKSNGIEIPRRDLFDIRAQLMTEDGHLHTNAVAGLSNDDIIPNIYEGGFKTWECSVDLSNYIWSSNDICDTASFKDFSIVELGAGTALPSITLARKWLLRRLANPEAEARLQMCLADYNRSVLELATIPNLYLAMHFCDKTISGNEIEIESEALRQVEKNLSKMGIGVTAISGSWTSELVELIPPISCSFPQRSHETFVVASETIYSLDSITAFTQTLLGILTKAQQQGSKVKALVAAKRVYFGVGGGADSFMKVLGDLGGRGCIVWETERSGLERVIIEVMIPEHNNSNASP